MNYINTTTRTPASRYQIRQAHPNVSLPRKPTDDALNPLGYAVVHPTEQPEGDVVTEGKPEKQVDGTWAQTWEVREFTSEELAERLEQRKQERAGEMDAARDAAFAAGMPYTFADGDDVVQTRPQDQINLMGLAAKAQRQLEAGDDTPMPFRALSNQTRMLTPAETDAMALAALAHIEGIYGRTWRAKDAVEAAETLEEVEAVEW